MFKSRLVLKNKLFLHTKNTLSFFIAFTTAGFKGCPVMAAKWLVLYQWAS